MSVILGLFLVLGAGDDGPGPALPDQEKVIATFREQLARRARPVDHFVRRHVAQLPATDAFSAVEWSVQVHGVYCKNHFRDARGVEHVIIMSPDDYFTLVKTPYDESWKLNNRAHLDGEMRSRHQNAWYSHAWLRGNYAEIETGPAGLLLEPPEWTMTRVTSERFGDVPVYRFQVRYKGMRMGTEEQRHGFVDVNPALSWSIVRMSIGHGQEGSNGTESEYEYEGSFAGLPALKRKTSWNWWITPDGKKQYGEPKIITVVQLTEETDFDRSEFTLDHYGLGPPYRAYLGLAATALVVAVALITLRSWLLTRRRRGLSWAVAAE
jgi:hypothetical protein